MYQSFLVCFMGLALVACGSLSLKVDSSPSEADVILHTENSSQKIGVTPLDLNAAILRDLPDGFVLEISKAEHIQQKVMIEKRSLSSRGKVSVKLQPASKTEAKINDPDVKNVIESIARQVSLIQSSLLKSEFVQAEVLTKSLLATYPNFSVGWNLLGNNYYLQGRYGDSVTAYQKALTLDPQNQETQTILNKLNRSPASGGL